jgi:hypothetical protein
LGRKEPAFKDPNSFEVSLLKTRVIGQLLLDDIGPIGPRRQQGSGNQGSELL